MSARHFNPIDAASAAEPGAVLGGYELVQALGDGGMGAVFRARNVRLDRMVRAIKVIRPELAGNAGFRERFLREAECLELLRHPNILRVENIGEDSGVLFMVMELLLGEGVDALLRRLGPLSVAVAAEIVHQALEGVQYAHERGVIHRDLKPANLFLTEPGAVKLLDFGIARREAATTRLTDRSQGTPGSPGYYAPEFADGAPASAASDIYALGISLYELLTGNLPFRSGGGTDGQAVASLLLQHATKPLPDPRASRPELPEALAAVISRAAAKKAEDRYPDAAAFARDLLPFRDERALQGLARPAQPTSAPPPPRSVGAATRNLRVVTPPGATPPAAGAVETSFHVPGGAGVISPPRTPAPLVTQFAVPASPPPDVPSGDATPAVGARGEPPRSLAMAVGLVAAAALALAGGAVVVNRMGLLRAEEPQAPASRSPPEVSSGPTHEKPPLAPPIVAKDGRPPKTEGAAIQARVKHSPPSLESIRTACLGGDIPFCVLLCKPSTPDCLRFARIFLARGEPRAARMYDAACDAGVAEACDTMSRSFTCATLGQRDPEQAASYHAKACKLRRSEFCRDLVSDCGK